MKKEVVKRVQDRVRQHYMDGQYVKILDSFPLKCLQLKSSSTAVEKSLFII